MKLRDCSNSLRVLQRLVTITRFLASTGTDTITIARILDEADYLISIIMHGEEEPGEFEHILIELGKKFPELQGLAGEYAQRIAA